MLKFSKYLIIIFFNLLTLNSLSQELDEVVDEINQTIDKHKVYKANITYKLYKDNNRKPIEKKSGFYIRYNKNSYMSLSEAEMIVTGSISIKINHKEKAMLLSNPLPQDKMFFLDFSKLQSVDIELDKKTDYWLISVSAKDISQFPFTKIELFFDKNNYLLNKQVIYYRAQINYDEKNIRYHFENYKLELEIFNYKFDVKINKNIFNNAYYFTREKEKIVGKNRYKNYKIIDYRKK